MSDQTFVAAPSAAQEIPAFEIERGPLVNLTPEQRAEFRKTGELPKQDQPVKAEPPAPADTSKETPSEAEEAKSSPDPESGKPTQETRRKPGAEARIAELTAERNRLRAELEAARRPQTTQAEPSPAKPAPQQQYTREKPKPDATKPDGTAMYASYEDYVEDLADWKGEQKIVEYKRQQAAEAQQREIQAKSEAARQKYGDDFENIIEPTAGAILSDEAISLEVKRAISQSEVLPELMVAIANDPKGMQALKSDPISAIRYIAKLEAGIGTESAPTGDAPARNGKGQFTKAEEPPAPPKTKAPEPPSEVGGRSATPPDEVESAVRANDFRRVAREWTRQATARK